MQLSERITAQPEATTASAPHPGWLHPAIAVLLVSGFFLRLLFYTGPVGSDDVNYFHFAHKLLNGQPFDTVHHHGGRLAFLAIVGVSAALFDHIHYGAVANVLLLSARDVVLTLFVLRAIGGIPAVYAAAVLSLNAISTVYASTFLPDGMLSFAMAGSSIVAYKALCADDHRTTAWTFLAGVLAAIAYSTKDTGVLLVPPTALAILYWCRGPMKLWALVSYGLGCTLIVALEMLAYWGLANDPLYRLHAISAAHNESVEPATGLLDFARRAYWNLVAVTKPFTTSFQVLVLFIPAAALALLDRSRRLLFPITGVFIVLYLVFGTSSLSRLLPLPVQDRYFEVIVPYVALSLAMAVSVARLSRLARSLPALIVFSGAMIATAAPSVAYNAGDITFSALAKNTALALKIAKERYPELPVYASPDIRFTLEPFVEPEVYQQLKLVQIETPLLPGLYIVHPWKDYGPHATGVYRAIESLPVAAAVSLDWRVVGSLKLPRMGHDVSGDVRVRTQRALD